MPNIKEQADEIWKSVDDLDKFVERLEQVDLSVVRVLIARLGSTGILGAQYEARRDAAIAVLQSRLATHQVNALERLNSSTTYLAKVGIVVAIVAAIAAIVQVYLALIK